MLSVCMYVSICVYNLIKLSGNHPTNLAREGCAAIKTGKANGEEILEVKPTQYNFETGS